MRCSTISLLHREAIHHSFFSFSLCKYSTRYVVGRGALVLAWLLRESCFFETGIIRNLVSMGKPTILSPALRYIHINNVRRIYGGVIALRKMFGTPYLNVVSCIVPFATQYICDKIFSKVLRRLDTVNAEEWAMSAFDRFPVYVFFVITCVINVFVLPGFGE